jgi:hypothetical protein
VKPKGRTDVSGLSATDWGPLFRKAGVEIEKLDAAKSKQATATLLGSWLARNADREVAITVGDRTGKARLRIRKGRSKQKFYVFEVNWDEVDGDEARGPEVPPGSMPTTMSGVKQNVGVKGAAATRGEQGNTDKAPKRSPATGKRKKAVAKKKASLPKKNETAKPSALNKQLPAQGHQQGNTESW